MSDDSFAPSRVLKRFKIDQQEKQDAKVKRQEIQLKGAHDSMRRLLNEQVDYLNFPITIALEDRYRMSYHEEQTEIVYKKLCEIVCKWNNLEPNEDATYVVKIVNGGQEQEYTEGSVPFDADLVVDLHEKEPVKEKM